MEMRKTLFGLLPALVGLACASVPEATPPEAFTVEASPGYNSWPMVQALGDRLVCAYSRGRRHTIHEGERGVFARTSADGGRTWTPEVPVAVDPAYGEVTIGKGLDADGAMLLWVRCYGGPKPHHDLYRTVDGVRFTRISTPALSPLPMQITDVVKVPSGLMSLWFATDYKRADRCAWGTLVSKDNGATWVQRTVARGMPVADLPTEPSAVTLGGGRLLVIARTESGAGRTQFQITSTDGGETWKCVRTNIGDVNSSTPSLVYDPATGLVSNYYYERGRGLLKRRVAKADAIFDRPDAWPEPEIVGHGREDRPYDAGNVNATVLGSVHCLAYYQGDRTNTVVSVLSTKAP